MSYTEETQEDFAEQLKMDAAEEAFNEMEEAKKEYRISNDYELFTETYSDEFEEATDALKVLSDLHKKYNHDFDCREML